MRFGHDLSLALGERRAGSCHAQIVEEEDDDDADVPSECHYCKRGGSLLCCDGCPKAFHLKCLYPPLKKPPTTDWFCPDCKEKQKAEAEAAKAKAAKPAAAAAKGRASRRK